jgi:hypothetical protein
MTKSKALPLGGDVYFELEPVHDGIKISVYSEDGATEDVHYSVTEPSRDFFTSEQKRRTLLNRVEEALPEYLDHEEAMEKVRKFLNQLAHGLDEETEAALQAPVVQDLRRQTEEVVYIPDEELRIIVRLSVDGREGELEFTAGEWNAPSPKPLRDRYLTEFYDRIELESDHWEDLTEWWHEQREIEQREELTKQEAIVEDTLKRLQMQQLRVYNDRKHFQEPEATWSAFYDDENELQDTDVPNDETVVWVRSDTLREILDDEGHGAGYLSQLSQELYASGTTLSKSCEKGLVTRVYPFKPEAVGVEDADLHVIYPERDDDGVEI